MERHILEKGLFMSCNPSRDATGFMTIDQHITVRQKSQNASNMCSEKLMCVVLSQLAGALKIHLEKTRHTAESEHALK